MFILPRAAAAALSCWLLGWGTAAEVAAEVMTAPMTAEDVMFKVPGLPRSFRDGELVYKAIWESNPCRIYPAFHYSSGISWQLS